MSDSVPMINRVAVVVEPKEPYLAWARSLDEEETGIDSMPRQNLTSVYLIEENEEEDQALQPHWDWIFEENLHAWCRDPSLWPQNRTYSVFMEWLDVRIVGIVYDLVDGPLTHEDI